MDENELAKYPGLFRRGSVWQVQKKGRRDKAHLMAPNTVASYLQALSAIFNWAKEEEWLSKNPAEGLGEKGEANVKRRAFESAELRTVFTALRLETPSRFWIPALGLYSGARLNELCQLAASDIGEADGIHLMNFSIFDAEGIALLDDLIDQSRPLFGVWWINIDPE